MVTGNKLRWAIGSAEGPRSSAWILWGNIKGDFYVAVRSLGGITKFSFHRDGKCQVGFTKEYAATASRRFAILSRHWEMWRLPAHPVVRVLQVLVPHSELRSFTDRNKLGNLIWLPAPAERSVAVVSIAVCAQDIDLPMPSNATIVGSVPTSIRTAWLVYAHNPIDVTMAMLIDKEREKLKRIAEASNYPRSTRATLVESRDDHDRHVLELASD